MAYEFTSARELFEAAREASRDAERIRRQLDAIEHRALGMSGGGFDPRVRSTPAHDRMGAAVASLVDVESRLRERQDEDYRLIDLACAVLYGTESDAGLWALVGWRADAIFHHYLGGMTWHAVGVLMGYTERHVMEQARYAMEVCDGWGLPAIVTGEGGAEG